MAYPTPGDTPIRSFRDRLTNRPEQRIGRTFPLIYSGLAAGAAAASLLGKGRGSDSKMPSHFKFKGKGKGSVRTGFKSKFKGYNAGRQFLRQPKSELKCFDTATGNLNFKPTGNLRLIHVPVPGTDLYNRVGRKTYVKSVHISGFINVLATNTQDLGRIVVFWDTQSNNAAPAANDVFQDMTAGAATSVTSGMNLNNRQRFTILKDYFVSLPSVTYTAGVLTNYTLDDPILHPQLINWHLPLNMSETIFAGNAGTIADIYSGALFVLCFSLNNTDKMAFNFQSRVRFYD